VKKLILLFTIVVVAIVYGAWDNDKPADSDAWNNAAGYIRNNNDALEVELGIDLNEAHPYFQASAPTKKPDGSTALDVDDNGRLWVDSDDNVVYILTDYSGPTWTAQTAASSIASADPTFTLQNTDEENTAGGRQSRFIAKGEQDGTEVTTLGFTEFSHDGSSDDEKGKWRVVLNSGSEGNSPTNVPIEYTADGKIKVSTSLSVLDEDDLTSDGDKVLATQQSIKAYIDAQIVAATLVTQATASIFGTRTTKDTGGSNDIAKTEIYLAQCDGFLILVGTANGEDITVHVGAASPPSTLVVNQAIGAATYKFSNMVPVRLGEYVEFNCDTGDPTVYWQPIGTGGLVKQ